MRVSHVAAAGLAATLLASCGGGNSNNGGGGGDNSLPTLTVTLSDTEQTVTVPEGGTAAFNFVATYDGTSDQTIIPNVVIDAERYQLVGTPTPSGKSYTVNLATVPFAPGGLTTSTIFFRLCADTECTRIYPGSTRPLTLNLDIQVKDWETVQRLADHRGHADVSYNKDDFARKWEYTAATGSTVGNAVATRKRVFLTEHAADGKYYALSINSTTGAVDFRKDLGTDPVSDPAFHDGKIYFTATAASGTKTPIVVEEIGGAVSALPAYTVSGTSMNQPVPFMGGLFFNAGAGGMVAHAYNLTTAALAWLHDTGGVIMQDAAPAVDANYVYSFTGPTIQVLARGTGNPVASFANADFAGGSQWLSAPILDPAGRLVAFTRSRGFATATPLASWGIAAGTRSWITSELYSGGPALGHNYLFAVNPDNRRLDAINPASGAVAYSLTIPGTGALTGNVVSTRSHVFVSTGTDSYAFNITAAAHPQDWTAAVGGKLSLTPDNQLIIARDNKVTSYRLW